MNGELAQLIALATYGNHFLSAAGTTGPEMFRSHSTFQFVSDISFKRRATRFGLFKREEIIARDTRSWFAALKKAGVKNLQLAFFPRPSRIISSQISPVFGMCGGGETILATDRQTIPYHMAVAFAGGGDWAMKADSAITSELWQATWSVSRGTDQKQQRIWAVEYGANSGSPAEINIANLPQVMKDLEAALTAAGTLAEEAGLVHWADWFAQALSLLYDPAPTIPYHPDLLPASLQSPYCRQLLASASKAWVFGGMGSWNDDGLPYDPITYKLFDAVMRAIIAATNLASQPAAARVCESVSGTCKSSEQVAKVPDTAYWLRRLQTDRREEAVQALVRAGAAAIGELMVKSSAERFYGDIEELLRRALKQVDRESLLLQLADHPTGFVRAQALLLLSEFAGEATPATAAFRKALDDPDPPVRVVAVQGLRKTGAQKEAVIPELIGLIRKEPSDSVCIEAMRTLAALGPAGAAFLREAQDDADERMGDLYADAFNSGWEAAQE
jgi:hypothetical protein